MNEVKGKNALALSRDLNMSHKACWVLLHNGAKMRRADNGAQGRRVTELAPKRGPSRDIAGYYRRHKGSLICASFSRILIWINIPKRETCEIKIVICGHMVPCGVPRLPT